MKRKFYVDHFEYIEDNENVYPMLKAFKYWEKIKRKIKNTTFLDVNYVF